MPETSPLEGFARIVTSPARDRLRTFDITTRDALNQLMDDLADNPDQYPLRVRSISRDGRTLLYTHERPPFEITFELDREQRKIYFLHFAAPRLDTPKLVFISYCHRDQEWVEKIKKWLDPLAQKGLLGMWADTDIKPGEDWRKAIEKALTDAKAALLLVTQDFLTSEFIRTHELPQLLDAAKANGVVILWVAVADSLWKEYAIERYQAVNDPQRPLATLRQDELDTTMRELYTKIKVAVEA